MFLLLSKAKVLYILKITEKGIQVTIYLLFASIQLGDNYKTL